MACLPRYCISIAVSVRCSCSASFSSAIRSFLATTCPRTSAQAQSPGAKPITSQTVVNRSILAAIRPRSWPPPAGSRHHARARAAGARRNAPLHIAARAHRHRHTKAHRQNAADAAETACGAERRQWTGKESARLESRPRQRFWSGERAGRFSQASAQGARPLSKVARHGLGEAQLSSLGGGSRQAMTLARESHNLHALRVKSPRRDGQSIRVRGALASFSKVARSSASSRLRRATVSLSSFSRASTTRTCSVRRCSLSTTSSSELKLAYCGRAGSQS